MRSARVILLGGVSAMATAVGLMTTVPAWAQPASVPHWGNTGTTSTHLTTPDGNGNPAMTKSTRMTMNQGGGGTALARDIQIVRQATAKYATNLAKAKADGYQIITKMMPGMGFHYLNPNIPGFSLRKPQILVYEHIPARSSTSGTQTWSPCTPGSGTRTGLACSPARIRISRRSTAVD
jgi:hypothetical protein